MSAWLLAALFCMPVSAQVFETGGAAAPVAPVSGAAGSIAGAGAALSPISAVPGAASLAPSLNSAVIQAFPGRAATSLPAGAVRFAPAPLPALPAAAAAAGAAAAPGPAHRDATAPDAARPAREAIPPSIDAAEAAPRAVAADRRRSAPADASPAGAADRLDAAGRELSAPLDEAGGLDRASPEGSVALGRKIFDRAGDRALLADGSAAGTPGASAPSAAEGPSSERRDPLLAASAGGSVEGESLRDAVASPVPAAAAPGAAFSFFRVPGSLFAPSRGGAAAVPASAAAGAAAPVTFERLSLELGSGLVVKVRAALGLGAAATSGPLGAAAKAALSARRPRAPITSTEWLERRGLLESISVSEAAASQEAALLSPAMIVPADAAPGFRAAPAPRFAAESATPLDGSAPVRVPPAAWWGLAFLPAALVLLKESF